MVLSKLDIVVDDLDVVGGEGMGSVGSELSLKYTSKTAVRNACANLVIKTFPNCWLIENATTMSIIRLSYLPSTPPLTLTFLSVNSCRTRSCRRKSRHFAGHGSFPRPSHLFGRIHFSLLYRHLRWLQRRGTQANQEENHFELRCLKIWLAEDQSR